MSRGIAKKAYTYGRRNSMDMVSISNYVKEAINSYNKMTPEMESAIKDIVEFKYPKDDDVDSAPFNEKENDSKVQLDKNAVIADSVSNEDKGLFDIKKLNDIEDKVTRGSLKKIYMASKRASKNSNETVSDMLSYLDSEDKSSNDINKLLNSLIPSDTKKNSESKESTSNKEVPVTSLFDIKKLNDIDDKVIRGSLKKIYMAGKRNKLNSEDVINDMLKHLEESDKKDDKLVKYLKGLI